MILDDKPPPGAARAWTPAETATLRQLWRTASDAELLAALPGRTLRACRGRARDRFGLLLQDRPGHRSPGYRPAWRAQPDPPIGSRWRITQLNSRLSPGDWRVIGYQGGGQRIVCEYEDVPGKRVMMTTEDFKRSIYTTSAQRLPDADEEAAR